MSTIQANKPTATTRAALIEAGTRLILEKRYNHCGLEEILKEAKVHRGSFYHYFKTKEEFGLVVVDEYAAMRLGSLDEELGNCELRPLARPAVH